MDQIQIQIQASLKSEIQIHISKIQIQIRKYKYVFDPIPDDDPTNLRLFSLKVQETLKMECVIDDLNGLEQT